MGLSEIETNSIINNVETEGKEHFEVSKKAIGVLQQYYPNYRSKEYKRIKRRQMSTDGYAISREDNSIDVVCDVLTSLATLNKDDDNIKIFEKVYHTIGNFIPIPEGANYGGSAGKSDNYEYKINCIKNIFGTKDFDKNSLYSVQERIDKNCTLGNIRNKFKVKNNIATLQDKACLQYWIKNEWVDRGKDWNTYIKENFLQDYISSYNNIYPFDEKDVARCIILIIQRGYRIVKQKYDNTFNDDETNDIKDLLVEIGLFEKNSQEYNDFKCICAEKEYN